MRKLGIIFGLLLFVVMSGFALADDPPPVRIMPLGDSLTFGYTVPTYLTGYRSRLYSLLVAGGYNVDFVGTQVDPQDSSLPDLDHEGHPGYRIDQIHAGIGDWLNAVSDPDVILLLIGTNDFWQNYDTANAGVRLQNLLAQISSLRPYAKIIVANLPLRTDPGTIEAAQNAFNVTIPGIVSGQVSLGRQVSFVDMHSSFNASGLSSDGVHPNQAGFNMMADTWLPAITNVISPLGTANPPAIARIRQLEPNQIAVTFSKPVEDAATALGNFGMSGGVTISQAALDPGTKRTITLTTSPLAAYGSYTLSVSGVRDRTAAHHPIAPGATAVFTAVGPFRNGSFESADYAGWTVSGNHTIKLNNTYPTTDGANVLVFNDGQLAPNGVVAQNFITTPGQAYVLRFDAGVTPYSTNEQRLEATLQGNGVLLADTVSVFGLGGSAASWAAKSYSFVANSGVTTLTFRDRSPTSFNVDLLLDHVRVSAAVARTLTVTSSPDSGLTVTVSPADSNGDGGGTSGFSRVYSEGIVVSLTAPATNGGNIFQKWQKNGADIGSSVSINVTMDGDHALNAVYVPAGPFANGSFESGDYAGWTVSGNHTIKLNNTYPTTDGANVLVFNDGQLAPNGVVAQNFITTPGQAYVLQFDAGAIGWTTDEQRLEMMLRGTGVLLMDTVSIFAPGGGATSWTAKSYPFVADSQVTNLTFRDVSPTSFNLDLLLDHVRIVVVDTTPPVITLLGANPLLVGVGATFADPGATATDNVDGNLTAQITVSGGPVVTGAPGSFTLSYHVSDAAGNAAVAVTRTVNVVNEAPVVARTLAEVTVNEGSITSNSGTFSDPQGNGTVAITASVGTVTKDDLNGTWAWSHTPGDGPEGSTTVTVTATDNGIPPQAATTTFILVVNNVAPVAVDQTVSTAEDTAKGITLVATDTGADTVSYEIVSGPPVGQGVLGALSGAQVTFTPAADFVGSTGFTFRATDSDGAVGNVATVTIHVTDATPPVITLVGPNPFVVPLGGAFLDPGATAIDNVDGNLTTQITVNGGPVVTGDPGSVTLTYHVSDGAGNAAVAVARTVLVVKVAAPTLLLELVDNPTKDTRITFPTVVGLDYTLFTSPDLLTWSPLHTASGDGLDLQIVHTGGGNHPPSFYRVNVKVSGQ